MAESDRLGEIADRLAAATPQPWTARDGLGHPYVDSPAGALPATEADADLIAHAPADMRWLIECVEVYRGTLAMSVKEHIADVAALTRGPVVSGDVVAEVAAVLAEHREDGTYPDSCICENVVPDAEGHYVAHVAEVLAPLIAERVEAAKAEAWDEGHRDGCDDHLCEQMGHLARNPYRAEETGGDRR